jgi:pimeloyl-ACP methyl ester carboxylesterase
VSTPREETNALSEHRFHTGTIEINYVEGPATGPPFVLLHGGSARWQAGSALIDLLIPRFHVYAPDLRGHGLSGRVPGRYQVRDYVQDIVLLLQQVVGEPAIVYGHSLGGEVAVMMAGLHPALVRALIVGDAPLSRENQAIEVPSHRLQNELWYELAASDKTIEEIAAALRDMPIPVPSRQELQRAGDVFGEDNGWFPYQAENLHLLDPDMLAAVLQGPDYMLEGYDTERLLPAISCPVLILRADPAVWSALQDEEIRRALELLPDGRVVQLDGIGHELHSPPDHAAVVLHAMEEFLASI